MSSEIYNFIYRLNEFSKDIYTNNDLGKINKELEEINMMYDELMESKNINNMAKEYILSKFRKLDEVNMYIVPVIKYMSDDIDKRYRKFYCLDNSEPDILTYH